MTTCCRQTQRTCHSSEWTRTIGLPRHNQRTNTENLLQQSANTRKRVITLEQHRELVTTTSRQIMRTCGNIQRAETMRTCHNILLTRTVGLTLCTNQQTNTEKLSQQPKNKHRETVIQRSVKSVFHLDDITTHKLQRTYHRIQQTTRYCDNIQWQNAENVSQHSADNGIL